MESQNELKWYQKPEGVIALLILFFPAGLYLMWKDEHWTKQTRWIVTGVLAIIVLAYNGDESSSFSFSDSIEGTYLKEWDDGSTLEYTISGDVWYSLYKFKHCCDVYGVPYFKESSLSGPIRGNELYDHLFGQDRIGYIEDGNLHTQAGLALIVLEKQ